MSIQYTDPQLKALQLMLTEKEYAGPQAVLLKKVGEAIAKHKIYSNTAGFRCMLSIMRSDGEVKGFFWQLSIRNSKNSQVHVDEAIKELSNVGEGPVERMYMNQFIKRLSQADLDKAKSLRVSQAN